MPRPIKSARAKPGSDAPASPPPKAAPLSPQFTESQQSSPPSSPNRPENSPDSADGLPAEKLPEKELPEEELSPEELSPEELSLEELSLSATEPFPPGLFRVPVPNALFSKMPGLSDSALRSLLALIELSFRFDPAEGEWVHPGDWFSRSEVEAECGLSGQGTRNGLGELESLGWTEVDRSSQSHHHRLLLQVPSQRFTYVPTSLLEGTAEIGSGTALRILLVVLRRTWGWTCWETPSRETPSRETPSGTDPQSGKQTLVHDRWARLSNRALAEATGRSKSAVKRAARALQGEWIRRARPGNGPYQYRFLPGRVGNHSADNDSCDNHSGDSHSGDSHSTESSGKAPSFSGGAPHESPPDRQNSAPPSLQKESFSRDKHKKPQEKKEPAREGHSSRQESHAVPEERSPRGTPDSPPRNPSVHREPSAGGEPPPGKKPPSGEEGPNAGRQSSGRQSSGRPGPDFGDLPPEKRKLAEKLANVGVWAGRIAEVLSRFSRKRIQANFELYRRRAAVQTIRKPGAWLYEAITQGYALPEDDSTAGAETGPDPSGSLPPLQHKETVSKAKKDAYLAEGVGEDRFYECPPAPSKPDTRRFMYFAPGEGGPTRRR